MRTPNTLALLELFEQHAIDKRRLDKTLSPYTIKLSWRARPEPTIDSPRGNPRNPGYDDERSKMAGKAHNHQDSCVWPAYHCTCDMWR